MADGAIAARIERMARGIANENGVEFVHLEIVGAKRNMTVRIYIDKPGGVTLDDCSEFSRSIEALLDADDLIPTAYLLEVSSPGLERGLYSMSDFARFAGKRAKVRVKGSEGPKAYIGRIIGVDGDDIILEDKSAAGEVRFPYASVEKANLRVNLDEEFNRRRPTSESL